MRLLSPLALVTLALLLPLAALAQSSGEPKTPEIEVDPDDTDVSIGFSPRFGAFYTTTKGVGLGGRVRIRNLAYPGTVTIVDLRAQQRYQEAAAFVFTGDPYAARVFIGIGGRFENDNVRRYFGLGPQTLRETEVFANMQTTEAEVRLGWNPLENNRLLVQPVVRLLHWNVRSFRDRDDFAFINLDRDSQRNLAEATERPTTGLTYGLELVHSRLDRPRYPSRGTLFEIAGRRYDGLGDNAFQYWFTTARAYGFVPTTGRQVLFARAIVAFTRRIGDEPIPFFALPAIDNRLLGSYTRFRFAGNVLLALSVGYRLPVYTFYDWFALDANVQVSAANAYDDLFEQFEPGISFDTDLRDEGERTPLRPSLSLGLDLVNVDEGRILIGGQLGLDPEGYRLGTMRFVYTFRDVRSLIR